MKPCRQASVRLDDRVAASERRMTMDDKQFGSLYFAVVVTGTIQAGLLGGILAALFILLDKLA